MVRSYDRHGPVEAFGIVASNTANSIFDGKVAYVPACEDVLVWNMKKGELLGMWHETGFRSAVTCLARCPGKTDLFAVGYQDGSIRIWQSGSVVVTFNGHRKAVTALCFDRDGGRLASGSQDTDIILWDVVAENGMFRLRGHRDQITSLCFISAAPEQSADDLPEASTSTATSLPPPHQTHLVSSSKDTLIKLWDLSTQHCVSTVVAHRTQVWSVDTFVDQSTGNVLVISGGGEGEAKAWIIDAAVLSGSRPVPLDGQSDTPLRAIRPLVEGLLPLSTLSHTQRIAQIQYHPTENILAVQTTEKVIEILRLRTEEEIRKKVARRRKREKEKKDKKKVVNGHTDAAAEEAESSIKDPTWKDRLASWIVIRTNGKIRSFDFGLGNRNMKGYVTIMAALANNAIEVYQLPPQQKKSKKSEEAEETAEATRLYALELPGHRTDIRTLCLSSDDALLASGANGSLKVWNVKTTKCLRTIDCGYALCSAFLPGDRHIVVGTKSGELYLYDVGSSTLLEVTQAHSGEIWGISLRADGKGLVTGSADKDVKFWDFEIKDVILNPEEADTGAGKAVRKTLTLVHTKTLKMTDDVLSVKYSPDGRLLAVALLDFTVKVFYSDSLKFFLSLYGHKLPVLSMDISSDSKLIITSSADKNVKIWGLDFGDCHRSLFAHDDTVTQVQFEKDTHYFWSVGKDRLVKYWDGDKFECIQKLEGHHGEVWAVAVSHKGKFVASAAHDKSIRIWEKLDEPLFLEEERERELEAAYDANLERDRERDELRAVREGDVGPEATAVEKTTTETLMAGERIAEALDISDEDRISLDAFEATKKDMPAEQAQKLAPRQRNAIFSMYGGDIEPELHVLRVVQKIPPASLNDALLVLPFAKVVSMLRHIDFWAKKQLSIPLISRILFFLLKTHYSQIIATRLMRTTILQLREHLTAALNNQKNTVGYNMAALKQVKRHQKTSKINDFYETEGFENADHLQAHLDEGIKKRKRATVQA